MELWKFKETLENQAIQEIQGNSRNSRDIQSVRDKGSYLPWNYGNSRKFKEFKGYTDGVAVGARGECGKRI